MCLDNRGFVLTRCIVPAEEFAAETVECPEESAAGNVVETEEPDWGSEGLLLGIITDLVAEVAADAI